MGERTAYEGFIAGLPKAELHVHHVGSARPETVARLAERHPVVHNLVISNVPGPPMPVYLLGRPLRSIHPFVPLSPQRRALSIGVISYDGRLYFGFTGDRDRLDDLDDFAGFVEDELAAIGV